MFINGAVKPHTLSARAPQIQLFKVLEQKMGGGRSKDVSIHTWNERKILHDLKKPYICARTHTRAHTHF